MEMSWSHTPSSVWWALEASPSAVSLEGDQNSTQQPPNDPQCSMRTRSPTLRPRPQLPGKEVTNFYDYAACEGEEEGEEDIQQWILQHPSRGAIRVHQPGSSYSELVCCTIDTTADTIIARCLAKELHVHYGSGRQRSVRSDEKPLEIQNQFLRTLGYTNPQRVQLVGLNTDMGSLFKFVTGYEQGDKPEERVQLACTLKVKELAGLCVWSRRFCVLCGARLFIFPTSRPKGKPSLVLDLTGGNMVEHRSKRSYYCVKVSASRREVLLAFDTRLEQSKWLERAAKVVSKHPLEANLTGQSLQRIPKYFFLNYYLVAMNLSRNIMKENYSHTVTSLGSKVRVIGWINDLSYFRHLVSLSLSDNQLDQFPVSLCAVHTLQELDVSRNKIKVLPQEIQRLTCLTTLLLHSNQLTSLPRSLVDLKQLATLVLAFNQFIELPPLLKEVSSLTTLIVSGNKISTIPDDVSLLENLQHLDYRLNQLQSTLPSATRDLTKLTRLNVRGTNLREINPKDVPFVEELNCADNRLRSLVLYEGPLRSLIASNNNISQFSVAPTCSHLTSINISRNQLVSLPEPITGLQSLQKLDASHNRLTKLPAGIFTSSELQTLQASNNHITSLPVTVTEGCGLQVINLHGNRLTSLPQQLIMRTPHLHTLVVSSNQLSVLPLVSPHGAGPPLTTLLAADNRLGDGSLPSLACCKSLKVLHLAYNVFQNILPSTFAHLKQLEYLNLSGNGLSSFPSLPYCFHLHTLSLHSSLLTILPEDTPPMRKLVSLDLAGNKLTQLPKLMKSSQLKYLDLSDNVDLKIREMDDIDRLKSLTRCVLEGGLGIHSDARMMSQVESGGVPSHAYWTFGSAQTPGVTGGPDCTVQVKTVLDSGRDGLFAVLNGGRSVAAPAIIQKKLPDLLTSEFSAQGAEPKTKDTPPNLQYLTHTFLAAHQLLGETGCSYGCSLVLCHVHMLRSRKLVLNVANAGLEEAILCRSGRAVPLTTAHSPATNREERDRVKEAGSFISQDYRVNGVCGTTRLVGCYHLGPEVIPAPTTQSITLGPGDDYIILGTDSLWRHVSHEKAVHIVMGTRNASSAARKLRDVAVGCGCKNDVSVIVVKLNLGTEPDESPVHSNTLVSGLESDLNPSNEDIEFTNIDDILSDAEDDVEPGHDQSAWNGVKMKRKHVQSREGGRVDIDHMILSAVSAPSTSPVSPEMKSTNIDDILSPLPLHQPPNLHSSHTTRRSGTSPAGGGGGEGKGRLNVRTPPPANIVGYLAQTIPRDVSGSRTKGGDSSPPPPPSQVIDYEQFRDSFEVTQSAPSIPADQPSHAPRREGDIVQRPADEVGFGGSLRREEKGERRDLKRDAHMRGLRGNLTRAEVGGNMRGEGNMEGYLEQLNRVMTELDSDTALGTDQPQYGGKIQHRLSYVEHSYKQLTNDVYSKDVHVAQEDEDNNW